MKVPKVLEPLGTGVANIRKNKKKVKEKRNEHWHDYCQYTCNHFYMQHCRIY